MEEDKEALIAVEVAKIKQGKVTAKLELSFKHGVLMAASVKDRPLFAQ
jgi:hypothetical protein